MVFRGFWLFLAFLCAVNSAAAEEAVPADTTPATTSVSSTAKPNPDPWEGFNRGVFRFNDTLDRYILRPVAKGYKKITPTPVRTGITNLFDNLGMPIVMLNDLLQGKVKQAGKDTTRFVVNSTLGVVGFVDVAKRMSLPANDEDFGQTLGKWGIGPGPYLMLPFWGPSSVRDTAGLGVDSATNPRSYWLDGTTNLALTAVDGVNTRASLLDVEEIVQGDRYLFIRDLYLQRRAFLVNDGQVEDPFLDDEFDDPLEDEASGEPVAGEELPADEGDMGEETEPSPTTTAPQPEEGADSSTDTTE